MVSNFPAKKSRFPLKWLVIAVVVGGAIYYVPHLLSGSKNGAPQQAGGPATSVASVIVKPVTNWSEFSGILQAVHSVEIRPQVSGQIMQIGFADGAEVKKGQLLFIIDPRPYEAAVISTKGALAQAQSAFERAQKLVKTKAISRAEFETAQSAYEHALGDFKVAQVNLDYTHIAAPISGKISRAEVTEGNLVEAGGSAPLLASIVTVSPIYAAFDMDEATFLKTIQGVSAAKLKNVPVEVTLSNQNGAPLKATIHSFDNQLTPGSGTIRVRALLANKDASLIPGLYARVRIGGAEQQEAVLINPVAIGTDQSKKFVMVLGDDGKAQYREVKLGPVTDGLQVITDGLKAGEKVIVNPQAARPGMPVNPKEVDMVTLKGPDDAAATPTGDKPADGTAAPASDAAKTDAPKTEDAKAQTGSGDRDKPSDAGTTTDKPAAQ